MITLEVKNTVVLSDDEKLSVEHNEALFFYHSYTRSELELIEIAHDILTGHCNEGENSNYHLTDLGKDIDNLLSADELTDSQQEWLHYTIYDASDMITEIYAIEGYSCCYDDGDWGMWYNWESEDWDSEDC